MLMRSISIAVISTFLLSCGLGTFPKNPDIKYHYAIIMDCDYDANKVCVNVKKASCFEFDIISFSPYKIGNARAMPFGKCETIGGLLANDSKKVYNWQIEVNEWAKENKKCFKK